MHREQDDHVEARRIVVGRPGIFVPKDDEEGDEAEQRHDELAVPLLVPAERADGADGEAHEDERQEEHRELGQPGRRRGW